VYITACLCLLLSFQFSTYLFISRFLFLPSLSAQLSAKIARHEEEVTDSLISHERRMLVVEKGSSGAPRRLNTSEGDVDGSEEGSADGITAKQVSATILFSATTLFDTDQFLFLTVTVPFTYHQFWYLCNQLFINILSFTLSFFLSFFLSFTTSHFLSFLFPFLFI
jgi:hypothetical protein